MFSLKTHIHLGVLDTNRSAEFYEALFGAAPSIRGANVAIFELESPPLYLTLESRAPPGKRGRAQAARRAAHAAAAHETGGAAQFSLLLREPRDMGAAAVALRRAGVTLRLGDQAIEARDPDGNSWRVRFVPSTPDRAVVDAGEPR